MIRSNVAFREFKEFQFKRNDCPWNLLQIIWRRLSWMKYQIDSNLRQQIFLNEIAMKRFSFIGLQWIAGECRYSCDCFHKITLWSFLSTKNQFLVCLIFCSVCARVHITDRVYVHEYYEWVLFYERRNRKYRLKNLPVFFLSLFSSSLRLLCALAHSATLSQRSK